MSAAKALSIPQTFEEYCEVLRTLFIRQSDLQFQIGAWLAEVWERFPGERDNLPDILRTSKTALYEYRQLYTFYQTAGLDDVPDTMPRLNLLHRLGLLHEARKTGILTYTHFRQAMRIVRKLHRDTPRKQQVALACTWLETAHDDKQDVIDSKVAAALKGEEHQGMSIRYDSQGDDYRSALDIARSVETHIRGIRRSGHDVRVVVYEVHTDAK